MEQHERDGTLRARWNTSSVMGEFERDCRL
jgi:hypothetical protein